MKKGGDYNKIPNSKQIDRKLKQLTQWYESKCFKQKKDERGLKTYLIGCKYNIEKTKQKLKKYNELRTSKCEWFEGRDPHDPIAMDLLNIGACVPLPIRDENGATVIFLRPLTLDASKYTLNKILKFALMVGDLIMERDINVVENGITIVVDASGLSFGHVRQTTPNFLYGLVQVSKEAYPFKIKAIHLFNIPSYVKTLLTVLKTLMGPKLKDRLHNYGKDSNELYKHFKRELMPNEYGGSSGKLSDIIEVWKKILSENRERFLNGDL